ncbi:MarR family transcriptional regulator [Lentzea sp. E54]|uniref:MarR family transcriptional regulator n=1 Tax=Lentzea xerophila TaxID=3435883 RepID=UPI003DA38AA3
MPSKTRTPRTTADTTGSATTLRSVPDQTVAANLRTDTEDKLWKALHANPNSTAADLALLAQIGKSTAPKILAKWASDGAVTRTPGIAEGGRRAADLWSITDVDSAPVLADTATTKDYDAADTTQTEPDASVRQDTTPDHPDADSVTVAEEDSVDVTDTAADEAQAPVNSIAIDAVEAEPVVAEVSAPEAVDGGGGTTTERGVALISQKTARLAAGALRGMVEDYLRDHPGEEFGPAAIAKALDGKSSGAVSNALDKLVANGTAAQTNDKPKRFALALTQRTAIPVPTS